MIPGCGFELVRAPRLEDIIGALRKSHSYSLPKIGYKFKECVNVFDVGKCSSYNMQIVRLGERAKLVMLYEPAKVSAAPGGTNDQRMALSKAACDGSLKIEKGIRGQGWYQQE